MGLLSLVRWHKPSASKALLPIHPAAACWAGEQLLLCTALGAQLLLASAWKAQARVEVEWGTDMAKEMDAGTSKQKYKVGQVVTQG